MPRYKRYPKQPRKPTKSAYLKTIISQTRQDNQPLVILWDEDHLLHIPANFHILHAIRAPQDHTEQLLVRLPTRIPILTTYLVHGQLRITNLRNGTTYYLDRDTAKEQLQEIHDPLYADIINIITKYHHSPDNDANCEELLRHMGDDPHHTTPIQP